MLVFLAWLSLSTLRWVPICQVFNNFSGFLDHFVLGKLATSSIRVKVPIKCWWNNWQLFCMSNSRTGVYTPISLSVLTDEFMPRKDISPSQGKDSSTSHPLFGAIKWSLCGGTGKKWRQGTTLTFAATCPVGQVRFNFHSPYSNFHSPLKKCMFYNISFKTK